MLTVGRLLRIFLRFVLTLIIVAILFFNFKLLYSTQSIHEEIISELHGLKSALGNHADVDMQNIYPEGYVFMNAIYGLAWSNVLQHEEHNSKNFKEGHSQIQKAWDRINSDTARITFDQNQLIPYGAFYAGWNTYLLGKKLSLEEADERDSLEVFIFKQQCNSISEAIKRNIYPASYNGRAWPADAMVCVAALSLHDQLFTVEYDNIINDWLMGVKGRLDSNGLIPHSANDVGIVEQARGSSQSLILIFLHDINPQFANEQLTIYKSKFIETKFGLTGVREYPSGIIGNGDIDSGPVIFQMGAVATIVGMHALNLNNDPEIACRIQSEIETFGLPLTIGDSKKYLFGQLPMADAFITWGHSSKIEHKSRVYFVQFHFYSFLLIATLLVLLWLIRSRRIK